MHSPSRKLLAAVLAGLVCVAFSTVARANGVAWLGIWLGEHVSGIERSQEQIVSVVAVEPGGPAEAAGLLLFDLILKIDGRPVHSRRTVVCIVKAARPGQTLLLVIQRQLEQRTIRVTLAEWPEEGMAPPNLRCPPLEISFKGEVARARTADHSSSQHYLR